VHSKIMGFCSPAQAHSNPTRFSHGSSIGGERASGVSERLVSCHRCSTDRVQVQCSPSPKSATPTPNTMHLIRLTFNLRAAINPFTAHECHAENASWTCVLLSLRTRRDMSTKTSPLLKDTLVPNVRWESTVVGWGIRGR